MLVLRDNKTIESTEMQLVYTQLDQSRMVWQRKQNNRDNRNAAGVHQAKNGAADQSTSMK